MTYIFRMPRSVDNENLKTVIRDLEAWTSSIPSGETAVYFNFYDCSFICPAGIVLLGVYEDILNQKGISVFATVNHESRLVAFLKNYGIVPRTTMETAYEKAMKKFTFELKRVRSSSEAQAFADNILPHILRRTQCKKGTAASLSWGLWEILDNAGNHGYECYEKNDYPDSVYCCAFSYKDRVEIAVMDRGQGVHKSLLVKHPEILAENALTNAIKKGFTGHPIGSAGFGLYGTSELAKRGGGKFFMWSSGFGLKVRESNVIGFQCAGTVGTLVAFSFDVNVEAPYQDVVGGSPEDHFEDLNIGF